MALRSLMADTAPLKHDDFRHLWLANIVTVIGAQLNILAVPAQIYTVTGSSGYVGLSGLFGLVPLVIFGLYGGALADAMDRRILLHITTIGMIVSAAGFWAQAAMGLNNVWLILSLFAVQQAFFAINQPTRTAIIPKLVGKENIAAAVSLNMTVMQLGATTQRPGFRSVAEGFAFLLTQPIILMTFVVDLIAMIFGSPRALIPQMSHVDFGEGTDGGLMYALLFAALPIGAVLGGVFSGRVTAIARRGLGVTLAILVWGAAIVVMGLAVSQADGTIGLWAWIAFLAFAVGGTADMFSAVLRSTMLQEGVTDSMRGRLQGVFIVVVVGGPRLADIVHGAAGTRFSAGTVTAAGGVLVIIGTLIAVALVPRFLTWTPDQPIAADDGESADIDEFGVEKERT